MPITVRVLTPQRTLVNDEEFDTVVIPGATGEVGVEPDHSPMVTELQIGHMRTYQAGVAGALAVAGGFAEVRDDRLVVLTPSAEVPTEIDHARAEEARRRAEDRLKKAASGQDTGIDIDRAKVSLLRAINRISLTEQYRSMEG